MTTKKQQQNYYKVKTNKENLFVKIKTFMCGNMTLILTEHHPFVS